MASDKLNFDKLVNIDKDRLDEEWIDQPRLVWRFSEAETAAKDEMQRAKAGIDLVWSELWLNVLMTPSEYGLDPDKKPTEKTIEATITVNPQYQAALDAYHKAKELADHFGAAVSALGHRKSALESLVYLLNMNYFAPPKAPKGDEDTRERVKQAQRKKSRVVID